MSSLNHNPNQPNRRAWMIPGAVVVIAAVVLIVTQLPRGSGPGASPSPSPTKLVEHEVATDQGIVSFRLENGAIVVRLATAGTTTELGRASIATGGSAGFAMVCGPADGPDSHRYIFGRTDAGRAIEYAGPPALGQGTLDGTYLFVLLPGTVGTQQELKVTAAKGAQGGSLGFPGGVFADALTSGMRQASGCYVTG